MSSMLSWPCPRCGRPTTGTYTEGGARWALCADCLEAELPTRREPDRGPDRPTAWRAYNRGQEEYADGMD
jgi:hypothetical protein